MAGSDIHGGPLFTMTEAPADLVKVVATPRDIWPWSVPQAAARSAA
ncbi:hypothetical protein [Bifidobacterium sp. ESL0819]